MAGGARDHGPLALTSSQRAVRAAARALKALMRGAVRSSVIYFPVQSKTTIDRMLCAARVSFSPSLAPRASRRAVSVRASGKDSKSPNDRATAGGCFFFAAAVGSAAALHLPLSSPLVLLQALSTPTSGRMLRRWWTRLLFLPTWMASRRCHVGACGGRDCQGWDDPA